MHPYTDAPARSFWSRSVVRNLDVRTFVQTTAPLVVRGEKVATAGSCFAAHLIPYLTSAGIEYVRTEYTHPIYKQIPSESLGYGTFSAAYGNIYTARQLRQLQDRCLGRFVPLKDRLHVGDEVIDPFRPGLRLRSRSDREFDGLQRQHHRAVITALGQCDVFVFTFGLTEAWASKQDGSVYPACPGTIGGSFDPEQHVFLNFGVDEIVSDFSAFIETLRSYNPAVRIILTVSPVSLVATATDQHVVVATMYSKSVLRVAAEQIVRRHQQVTYFPAYEIVAGPQAPRDFLAADRRSPTEAAINMVMSAFLAACEIGQVDSAEHGPLEASAPRSFQAFARSLIERECEEAMVEK